MSATSLFTMISKSGGRADRFAVDHRCGIVPVWVLFFLVLPAIGAAATVGAVEGRVFDQTEAVIPGVMVHLLPVGAEAHLETVTEVDGSYRFAEVPAGPAELTFRLINFSTVRRQVNVTAGDAVTENVLMTVAITADITITAPKTFRNLAELDNPAENLVGVASSSSEGAITSAQLETRAIMRSAEVLEAVPGMIISQHSGEGKANQYYLRGFNLDHGFDFSQTIAGVPVNMPTHTHAHGYADANFLIPELVSGVQFRKGPYFADEGDFSAAGAANINYFNRLDRPVVSVAGGSDAYARFFGAASPELAGGNLLVAFEVAGDDGPWEHPNDHRKYNGVLRYSRGDTRNGFSVTGMAYSARWNSTDQVARRAIESGLIGRFGTIDPTNTGDAQRYSLAFDLQRAGARTSTRYTAYALQSGTNLIANFTYFLDDPVNGDQFEQDERRWVFGGSVTHRRFGSVRGYDTETSFGARLRYDAIDDLGLYRTRATQRLSTVRLDDVRQASAGFFGSTEIEWSRVFRTTFGLRGDIYRYDVISDNPLNSGVDSAGILSPKASVVLGPWSGTECYVNAGLGFHSNSALGATLTVDPVTGDPAERSTPIVRARGAEVGVRTVRIPGLQTTATLWYLGFDSELLFVGDAGTTEAGRPSRRIGIEITNYARLSSSVTADLDISFSRARFTDLDPVGNLVPGSLDRVISAGIASTSLGGVDGAFGSARLRHFGPRPLTEDGGIQSESTTILNGEVGYRFSEQVRLILEVYNVFDAEVSDIDYFYTSRLPGEPVGGIDDIHLHPALPRSARASLRVMF